MNQTKILNVGCGLHQYGTDRIDVEKNENTTMVYDIENGLPYGDNCFDEIYARGIIEHMKNPFNLILEMKRVCKKGGKIIVITDNAFWIQRHEHGDATFFHNKDGHYYLFHYSNLIRLFEQAGIKVTDGGYEEFEYLPQEKGLYPTSLKSKMYRRFQRFIFGNKRGYPHVRIEGEK